LLAAGQGQAPDRQHAATCAGPGDPARIKSKHTRASETEPSAGSFESSQRPAHCAGEQSNSRAWTFLITVRADSATRGLTPTALDQRTSIIRSNRRLSGKSRATRKTGRLGSGGAVSILHRRGRSEDPLSPPERPLVGGRTRSCGTRCRRTDLGIGLRLNVGGFPGTICALQDHGSDVELHVPTGSCLPPVSDGGTLAATQAGRIRGLHALGSLWKGRPP
jgi:hypothetical protein